MPSNKQIAVWGGASLAKARVTNQADLPFTAPTATATKPSGDGVVSLKANGAVPKWMFVSAYILGADNDVADLWVTGWRQVAGLWVPYRLVKLTWTASTFVGVAGAAVIATERLCDTVTASMGISNVSYQLFSPADNTPAHALVSPDGCDLVQFDLDNTTGTGTGNVLWAPL